MFLTLRSFAAPQRGGALILAAACFAAGLSAGAWLSPAGSRAVEASGPPPLAPALRAGHPVEVLRVFDGDTFEARVDIWPGMQITTKVRLRGIDAPEMHARCDDERSKAISARDALSRILAERRRGHCAHRSGQIWRPRRCRCVDRTHSRCVCRAARARPRPPV
jgi:endonuclease YncB( thermonuclease family)